MKKALLLSMFLIVVSAFAHRTLLLVDDNGDGTIYIEAGLSTGKPATGATITITERATGRPLWQGVVPEEGNLTTDRPSVEYSVTLSMGNGHDITKRGPELLPIEEPTEETVEEVESEDTDSLQEISDQHESE